MIFKSLLILIVLLSTVYTVIGINGNMTICNLLNLEDSLSKHVQKLSTETYIKACDESVFCQGKVLENIQTAHIFKDSKTFVDMPLKINYSKTVENEILENQTKDELRKTVEKYFNKPGSELQFVNISEHEHEPEFIKSIRSLEYKEWSKHLCSTWKKLVRKISVELKKNPNRYSLMYMEKSFVVPGGRFREMYYWDTYWSIEGLLICRMYNTTRDVLENLIQLVEENGFIPNGGRKYYQNRSQPPFLTLMIEKYWSVTRDDAFVKKHLSTLIKEHEFWMTTRAVNITLSNKTHILNRYSSMLGEPRPESFREDVELVKEAGHANNKTAAMEMYSHIASAAESGWDFSSRWFKNATKMTTIQTRNIIPVDLNAILCMVEFIIANLSQNIVQDFDSAKKFTRLATDRRQAIDEVLWDEKYGLWLDYNLLTEKLHEEYYASSIFPLWSYEINSTSWNKTRTDKAFDKLKRLGIFNYVGGIPTSLLTTGQQWNFPNAWPPLQHVTVNALKQVNLNTEEDEAKIIARQTAKKYLETAYLSWKTTTHMYEKYDVTERSRPGHGGEYEVQEGFGWTNGVALSFLNQYGRLLEAPNVNGNSGSGLISSVCDTMWFTVIFILLRN